jgi:hypothetical protein
VNGNQICITLLAAVTVTVNVTAEDACGNVSDEESFTVTGTCADLCDGDQKVATLTMQYVGGGCNNMSHSQEAGSVTCQESNGGVGGRNPVYIVVGSQSRLNHPNFEQYFAGSVNVDGEYVIQPPPRRRRDIGANTTIFIFTNSSKTTLLEKCTFHTSCSQPLFVGDIYGGNMIVDYTLAPPPGPQGPP